jgi:[protein-PII] uridylyltransferase
MELESSSASLPYTPSIVQVLDEHRALVARRVMAGASGAETLAAMTEFVDGLIIGRYREAMRQGGDEMTTIGMQQCCLMALGGYGRRELAPQSDIDLMFLYQAGTGKAVTAIRGAAPTVGLRISRRAQSGPSLTASSWRKPTPP